MRLQRRTGMAVTAVSTVALLGGGVAYAATQPTDPSGSAHAMASGQGMSMRMTMGMGSFAEDRPFDAQFLDQMSVHHQGAIMSTQAMIADSARPELRALAADIISSQRQQLTQMRAWRTEWYPALTPTFGASGAMMGSTETGSMMGGSMMGGPADTERMYLQMMIIHHQLAVDMADEAESGATHPQLKDLADTIATEQAAQIVQMRGYLDDLAEPADD